MNTNLLFIISGPSGTGKSSLLKRLSEVDPDLGFPVSHTSRAPREGEVEGVHYYFRSADEIMRMETCGDMVESNTTEDGTIYGLSKTEIRRMRRFKAAVVDLNSTGAKAVKTLLQDRAILIMLVPAYGDDLERRLKARGTEIPEEIDRRLGRAIIELSASNEYDYLVVNDNLDDALHRVQSIIQAEFLRMHRKNNEMHIENILDDLCGAI